MSNQLGEGKSDVAREQGGIQRRHGNDPHHTGERSPRGASPSQVIGRKQSGKEVENQGYALRGNQEIQHRSNQDEAQQQPKFRIDFCAPTLRGRGAGLKRFPTYRAFIVGSRPWNPKLLR
jgi:hypothetical protein